MFGPDIPSLKFASLKYKKKQKKKNCFFNLIRQLPNKLYIYYIMTIKVKG